MNTSSEEWRFQCEVRHIVKLGERANRYLNLVEERRGAEEASRLRVAARLQWSEGNRGEWGTWKVREAKAA